MQETSGSGRDPGAADLSSAEQIARGLRRGRPEHVEAVRTRVRRIISFRGFGIPAVDRKDIEQETMTQIWQAAAGAEFNPASGFWSFVDVVTARRCVDWYRRARAAEELDDGLVDGGPGPLSRALSRERLDLARQALAGLGEACRELIGMRVQQGLSFDEISRRLQRSPGALRVQFHRCVRRARGEITRLSGVAARRSEEE